MSNLSENTVLEIEKLVGYKLSKIEKSLVGAGYATGYRDAIIKMEAIVAESKGVVK